jgi:hypothetical protein
MMSFIDCLGDSSNSIPCSSGISVAYTSHSPSTVLLLLIHSPTSDQLKVTSASITDNKFSTMPSNELPMVKMIVLEVDEPHPDDQKEKGSLGEILERHFIKAGKNHDPPLGVEVDMRYIVEDNGGKIPSVEEFEGVRGILITGSTYDAHGDDKWIIKLMDLIKRESV